MTKCWFMLAGKCAYYVIVTFWYLKYFTINIFLPKFPSPQTETKQPPSIHGLSSAHWQAWWEVEGRLLLWPLSYPLSLSQMSPHSLTCVTSSHWDRPYSREVAAFPLVSSLLKLDTPAGPGSRAYEGPSPNPRAPLFSSPHYSYHM